MTEPAPPPQTVELIERAKGGDISARDELMARYEQRVLPVVRARMGRPLRQVVESMDILQEAMLEAVRAFPNFEVREDAHFFGWLATIVENRIRRIAEREGAAKRDRRREQPMDRPGQTSDFTHEPAAPQTSLGEHMIREEQREAVLACIGRLDERYREVILTRNYLGASWDEVARQTGQPSANAARMTYNRAKLALASLLRDEGIAPDGVE